MRIGHTRLTDGYLMAKEEAPLYEVCGVSLTVKHIITKCLKHKPNRQRTGIDESFYTALGPETKDKIKMIDFLKASDLYNLI